MPRSASNYRQDELRLKIRPSDEIKRTASVAEELETAISTIATIASRRRDGWETN